MPIAIVLAALLMAGCKSPTSPDVVAGKPFQLKVGETAELPDGATLRFNRVQSDSRCPIDAICISAGDAVISLTFARTHVTSELHTNPAQSQITYANYVIALTELQPYPRSDRQTRQEDYVATFLARAP